MTQQTDNQQDAPGGNAARVGMWQLSGTGLAGALMMAVVNVNTVTAEVKGLREEIRALSTSVAAASAKVARLEAQVEYLDRGSSGRGQPVERTK